MQRRSFDFFFLLGCETLGFEVKFRLLCFFPSHGTLFVPNFLKMEDTFLRWMQGHVNRCADMLGGSV